ncbi:MAG: primosomal protein N' [Myxococcales bacterium]|nr:primosomal protein N' [Myxococcales bacterium]
MSTRQAELFEAPPQEAAPAPRHRLFCEVAVPLPLRMRLTYAVPEALGKQVVPGVRVIVFVGPRRLVGYVIAAEVAPPAGIALEKIRPIVEVIDSEPAFPEDLLKFLREAAEYYMHPVGEVLRTAAPAIERRGKDDPRLSEEKGSLKARWARVREEVYVSLTEAARSAPPKVRGDKQAQLLSILSARGEVSMRELRQQMRDPRGAVEALEKRGAVSLTAREVPDDPFFGEPVPRDVPPPLTDSQRDAVEAIVTSVKNHERATYLLYGVTGSGKTEVYLRAMAAAQAAGRGAILMLPEIALTPQLVSRYRARFGDNLAVIHSGLKDNDRHAMWRKLHRGDCKVAIGARSAVFAPVRDLGLILVDEEHDPSFKQDDHFRYHGRDLALLRAHRAGVPCVLGSATPSVESYQGAMEGRYRLLHLPDRATRASMPSIEIVDLKRVGPRGPTGHELLSLPLVRAIADRLSRKEQVILFLNRRGFAPSVRCIRCDKAIECPSCSVALVMHRREGALRCHYCDFHVAFQNVCITCGCTELALVGVGTEKLENALVSSFPGARVGRLDRDVASGMGTEEVLDKLRKHEIDILVGTQMVTKGHDVPRVTLVGVIAADAALTFPDFRAAERTYQLLSQVAGRAGRRELPGHVIIQTWQPEHPVLGFARNHDYEGFFHNEIVARKELGYPPFGRMITIRMDGESEEALRAMAQRMDTFLRALPDVLLGMVKILGPAPAPIERIRGRFRMHTLLRGPERPPLRRVISRLIETLEDYTRDDLRVSIDIDPVNML